MIHSVTKKDGTKIAFSQEKITLAVMAAASEAGLSSDEASNLAEKVLRSVSVAFGDQGEVPTSQIREKVLLELDATAPAVSAAWRKYDQSMGK